MQGKTRVTMMRMGTFGLWAVLLSVLGAGIGQRALAEEASSGGWPPKTFPITFWCGPPDAFITVEQYKRIRDAGFTIVMPPCEGEASVARNRKILEAARMTGLKAVLADSRMPLAITGAPKAESDLKAIVNDYKRHPAFLGYFLTDEPGANQFAGLAEVAALLKKLDPTHLVYINLFPNYATTDQANAPGQLNAATYDLYLDKFMQTVKPDVLSWDFYGFTQGGDRPGFYGNLFSGQRAASATQPRTPFWQIVLSVQHGPYRPLTENELRYEAMQTLVYGASGLAYFTYWLPPDDATFQWSHAIMNRDGTPGPLYEPVKKVNQEVNALSTWLYGARLLRTFQSGQVPTDGRPQPDDVPVKVTGPGDLSVGLFRDNQAYVIVMVTNRDYRQAVSAKVRLNAGEHPIEALDRATNKWKPAKGQKDDDGATILTLELDPAGAALARWR